MCMLLLFQLIQENGFVRGYPGLGGRGTAPDYVGKFYYGSFPERFKWGLDTSAMNGKLLCKF